jgi:hypothetical protein
MLTLYRRNKVKVPVKVVIDLDVKSFRDEYLDQDETLDSMREFMKESVEWNLRDFVSRWPYIRGIEVK